jgi:predicted nucleic acid-binding protein
VLVFWDTNLFIYLFESHGDLSTITHELWSRMLARGDRLVTSALTVGEILAGVGPGRSELLVTSRSRLLEIATVCDFDDEAATHYAAVRQDRTIKPPDAIQLACAAKLGVSLFITNDDRLSRRLVPGIPILTSLRSVPI